MRVALAVASLARHRTRTALAVAGIAVASAMLLDMVMLSSGMRLSFRELLDTRGYQVRLSPKGTLPFDTEATVGDAAALVAAARAQPGVAVVAPNLGAQLVAPRGDGAVTVAALGVEAGVQGDYALREGRDAAAGELVASPAALAALGRRVGDTVSLGTGWDPQLRAFRELAPRRIVGVGRFYFLGADQPVVAMPLADLQATADGARRDRISSAMVRLAPGAEPAAVARALAAALPRVSVLTTADAVAQADERVAYFRNLAFILGSVSLAVGFLLVTTLMTVSVNERIGEIAVQRALGVQARRIVQQVVAEGLALSVAGGLLGLGLGLVTARYLDAILGDFPGLPPDIAFFVFQPRDAGTAMGLLVVAGTLAGILPSWRAARLPIAATLREEAVA
ncbi:MAG: ABC transporter permease [Gemmatimonadota bacterium]|jgi:putative ABC transport system permease protein|nr:ABC transporter permease [Gemmatimonadota bacterium]